LSPSLLAAAIYAAVFGCSSDFSPQPVAIALKERGGAPASLTPACIRASPTPVASSLQPSVVVILELVAYGDHDDIRTILDLEQGDVARPPEGDDQFSQKRTLGSLAACERRGLQGGDASPQGTDGLFGLLPVPLTPT
jgi:hypothetical protein